MTNIKRFISTALLGLGLLVGGLTFALPQQAAAQTPADEVCAGIAAASGKGCSGSNTSLNKVVTSGVNIFSVVIGIAAVIMIMVAGFKYITAAGDSGQISSAKSTLVYAIIGLVIVALAQSIVKFVLHAAIK